MLFPEWKFVTLLLFPALVWLLSEWSEANHAIRSLQQAKSKILALRWAALLFILAAIAFSAFNRTVFHITLLALCLWCLWRGATMVFWGNALLQDRPPPFSLQGGNGKRLITAGYALTALAPGLVWWAW